MTIVNELIQLREDILSSSKGQDGFIDEQLVLTEALELMFDAKLVDSQDFNDTFFKLNEPSTKLNGYAINDPGKTADLSGGRRFYKEDLEQEDALIYEKGVYENNSKEQFDLSEIL